MFIHVALKNISVLVKTIKVVAKPFLKVDIFVKSSIYLPLQRVLFLVERAHFRNYLKHFDICF